MSRLDGEVVKPVDLSPDKESRASQLADFMRRNFRVGSPFFIIDLLAREAYLTRFFFRLFWGRRPDFPDFYYTPRVITIDSREVERLVSERITETNQAMLAEENEMNRLAEEMIHTLDRIHFTAQEVVGDLRGARQDLAKETTTREHTKPQPTA
ncbi:MAG TPA: hypothetical protein VGB77_20670 [Abditibacteriaceae bacterium]|jgi:hypothetical protein